MYISHCEALYNSSARLCQRQSGGIRHTLIRGTLNTTVAEGIPTVIRIVIKKAWGSKRQRSGFVSG